jgi:hypothetical protein
MTWTRRSREQVERRDDARLVGTAERREQGLQRAHVELRKIETDVGRRLIQGLAEEPQVRQPQPPPHPDPGGGAQHHHAADPARRRRRGETAEYQQRAQGLAAALGEQIADLLHRRAQARRQRHVQQLAGGLVQRPAQGAVDPAQRHRDREPDSGGQQRAADQQTERSDRNAISALIRTAGHRNEQRNSDAKSGASTRSPGRAGCGTGTLRDHDLKTASLTSR